MEKNMNDGANFHCANGCGFFGAAATMNLCSKCYRDARLKAEQAAAIAKSMAASSSERVTSSAPLAVEEAKEVADAAKEVVVVEKVAVKSRCGCCDKKVGVMGFKCRCGNTFCGSHRYPEEHMCGFDFKSAGKEAVKKANPVVKADKINRF